MWCAVRYVVLCAALSVWCNMGRDVVCGGVLKGGDVLSVACVCCVV